MDRERSCTSPRSSLATEINRDTQRRRRRGGLSSIPLCAHAHMGKEETMRGERESERVRERKREKRENSPRGRLAMEAVIVMRRERESGRQRERRDHGRERKRVRERGRGRGREGERGREERESMGERKRGFLFSLFLINFPYKNKNISFFIIIFMRINLIKFS